jgi:hypothetical protein
MPGPSTLPDYSSTPHPGRTQLANLLLSAFERRLPETGNHSQALSAASEITHQDWIDKTIQWMYTMLEDCGYMAD